MMLEEILPFDVTDEIERRAVQQQRGFNRLLIALRALLADRDDPDARVRDPERDLPPRVAHEGELRQRLRRVDVGAGDQHSTNGRASGSPQRSPAGRSRQPNCWAILATPLFGRDDGPLAVHTSSTASPSSSRVQHACAAGAINRRRRPQRCTISTPAAPSSGRKRICIADLGLSTIPSCAASSVPATISSGAASPPIASTAMRGRCCSALNGNPIRRGRLSAVHDLDAARGEPRAHGIGVALRVVRCRCAPPCLIKAASCNPATVSSRRVRSERPAATDAERTAASAAAMASALASPSPRASWAARPVTTSSLGTTTTVLRVRDGTSAAARATAGSFGSRYTRSANVALTLASGVPDARTLRERDRHIGPEFARDPREPRARHDRNDRIGLGGNVDDEQPVLFRHILDLDAVELSVLCRKRLHGERVRRMNVHLDRRRAPGNDRSDSPWGSRSARSATSMVAAFRTNSTCRSGVRRRAARGAERRHAGAAEGRRVLARSGTNRSAPSKSSCAGRVNDTGLLKCRQLIGGALERGICGAHHSRPEAVQIGFAARDFLGGVGRTLRDGDHRPLDRRRQCGARGGKSGASSADCPTASRSRTVWAKPHWHLQRDPPGFPFRSRLPAAAADATAESGSRRTRCACCSAARAVTYMFEPVSPSGTGKTFKSLRT